MSTIRALFSARSARPKVEASMRALVHAAVYLASADGHVEETEVEALVDGLRAVVARTVGPELLDDYAKVSTLLDEARAAMRTLKTGGEAPFLAGITRALEGDFKKDAVDVALAVVFADGKTTAKKQTALDRLSQALGLSSPDVS